ncbi:major facilitator superfamily transporter [Wuchereria bancrofti]|uniref:Major facilitator superfamily transporter n=1 Tax=Wuchereria bancrofti TaxID=6293 RepID=J9AWL0_WUCBA|nr:major facilitator superfamily transporter [Wuchereria bancrofti]
MHLSKCYLQRRHLVVILAFLGFANIYAMRANLSVAIVQMTSDTVVTTVDGEQVKKAEFEWDTIAQGAILGAFFYGYFLTQLPGGYLAHHYGGKFIYCASVFGTAVFTLLSPPLAKFGKGSLIAARFWEGLFEVNFPLPSVMSAWCFISSNACYIGKLGTNDGKTRMSAISYSGSYFGTVIAMPVSAIVGHHFGWPSIFYFCGISALLWCFLWVKMFHDLPENDPNISTDELTLLKRGTKQAASSIVPWRRILSSKAVWAIVIAHVCQNWGFYIMLTSLPRIIENLLSYDREEAGSLSSLPYFVMGAVLLTAGGFTDYLRKNYMWSTTKARKVFCCLGLLGESAFLLLATAEMHRLLVLISLVISVGLGGLAWSAFSVNYLDIAPQYAGHLMGFSNTLATLPGMISPLFVGAVVKNQLRSEWHAVFFFTSGIYIFGSFMFWLWAKGELEEWSSHQAGLSQTDS